MYLVTGATGKTGGSVVQRLLDKGQRVRALVRSREKGKDLERRGVEIAVGVMEDVPALTAALDGVDGAYLMMPNDFESTDFVASGERRAEGYARAMEASGVRKAVGLSSVGAHRTSGNGVTLREHRFEQVFSGFPEVSFVRAGYFVENWAAVFEPAREGVLPTFLLVDVPIPMVSAVDIGECVADTLLASSPPRVSELAGPVDVAPEGVASTLSEIMEKEVRAVHESLDGIVPLFTGLGFTPHIANLVREMYEGYRNGTMAFAGEPIRGETPLDVSLRRLFS